MSMSWTVNWCPWDMCNMGSLLMRAGSEDRVSGFPGLLDAIGHAFVRGRLTLNLEVCIANCANVFLVSLAMGH